MIKDVAIIGAGIAGMATATRLQKLGYSTQLFEAHGQPGGCAGFYRRRGFSFDVGATTLVDFGPGGVGGEWLSSIDMPPLAWEELPGYMAWLPDRTVTLYRDATLWREERLRAFDSTPAYEAFWKFVDKLSHVFWEASRKGARLPIRSIKDIVRDIRALGVIHIPLARYLNWTMEDALRTFGLQQDSALTGLLAMLIEDTVHGSVEEAPLINAALGISIRGAGLTRVRGGMRGFWQALMTHYRGLGGELRVGCRVEQITGRDGRFYIRTRRGVFQAAQVVSTLPASLTSQIAPIQIARALRPYISRNAESLGGAFCVFLGVPEQEVCEQEFRHHQLLQDYKSPLGNGNNMFISVSAPGDTESAPPGYRSVMLSTHCAVEPWETLSAPAYQARKQTCGEYLISLARRVYPHLAEQASVYEVATPCTYQFFTSRPHGAVGGFRLALHNANQQAIPYNVGFPGFWLAGDTTWPGLGTVACVLGSRIVAEQVAENARYLRKSRWFFASSLQGGAHYA